MWDFLKGFKTIIGSTTLVVSIGLKYLGYDVPHDELEAVVNQTWTDWGIVIGTVTTWYGVVAAKVREWKNSKV